MKSISRQEALISIALAAMLAGCGTSHGLKSGEAPLAPEAAYTVKAENQRAIARAVTTASDCPQLQVDGRSIPMTLRAAPEIVPARGNGQDSKPARFEVRTCEAELPPGAASAEIGGLPIPVPHQEIKRIVVIGDTGCRLKRAESSYQPCNNAGEWPFAQVAQHAAALQPDLVIHLGDLHYRESPCPEGNADCAGSPWGFGYDAWAADFFGPARPLLAAAPWVFVRGNHETCARAGQGWFRFIDIQPWSRERSCNDPRQDVNADFSPPYALPLSPDTQLIVFDSGKTGFKPYKPSDHAYRQYLPQLQQAAQLASQAPQAIFLSHHPVLAFSEPRTAYPVDPGNAGLQSVMQTAFPGRYFPPQVTLALHGHVHLFEALNFESEHPATFVLGNSGSAPEGILPQRLPKGAQPAPGTLVQQFATLAQYGYASLDRLGEAWELTEWDVQGKPLYRCKLSGSKSQCTPMRADVGVDHPALQ